MSNPWVKIVKIAVVKNPARGDADVGDPNSHVLHYIVQVNKLIGG
jgi:hypothetical protein